MSVINTLHILPGPVYKPEDVVKSKYEKLSEFSRGSLVTLGPKDEEHTFGDYYIRLVGTNEQYNARSNFKLFIASLKEAKKMKNASGLDIVICYDPLKTGLIGYLIKKLFNCKMIVEVNGIYDSPELYRSRKGLLMKIKQAIYPAIQNFILRSADGVKCLFEGQVKNTLPVKGQILKCFFDFTQVTASSYKANKNPKLLSMGYPSYIKGMDILVEAFNRVATKFPNWTLDIVGYFSPVDRKSLQDLVKEKDRVFIRKPIDFAKVPELIDSCDIFVLASRTEAMGRVLLEAMARGRARIGSKVGGVPTVLSDGVDGLLFESKNVENLVEKMEGLMSSEIKRKDLAEAGIIRFNNEFTIDHYASHVKNLYEDVCKLEK